MLLLPLALIALLLLIDPPTQAREGLANPPTPPPPPAQPRTLAELQAEYTAKSARYTSLIDTAVRTGDTAKMNEIRQLNVELTSLLEQMLSTSSPLSRETQKLRQSRDELAARLRKVQMDYNGLVQTTDELETLRRIRAQESDGFTALFYWHLIFLGIVFVAVLAGMIYVRRQTTNATTASPTMSADLE